MRNSFRNRELYRAVDSRHGIGAFVSIDTLECVRTISMGVVKDGNDIDAFYACLAQQAKYESTRRHSDAGSG